MPLTSFVPYSWSAKQIYRSAPLGGEEVKIEGVPMTKGWVSPHPESRIPSTTQTVAQTSSPRGLRSKTGGRTEAFTAKDAENGTETLMLHLRDLCGKCLKLRFEFEDEQ